MPRPKYLSQKRRNLC